MTYTEALNYSKAAKAYLNERGIMSDINKIMLTSALSSKLKKEGQSKPVGIDLNQFRREYSKYYKKTDSVT